MPFFKSLRRAKKEDLTPEQIKLLKSLQEESEICRNLLEKSARSKHTCVTRENHGKDEKCGLEYDHVHMDYLRHRSIRECLKDQCVDAGIRRFLIDKFS